MFFKRKKTETPPSPPWLKWVVIGFFALALLTHMQKRGAGPDAIDQASQTLNPTKLFHFEEYKNKLMPGYRYSLRTRDIEQGEGTPALCGQQVTIAYDAFLDDNTPVEHVSAEKPLTFSIGEGNALPALEQGVVGMKKGGQRNILAAPDLAYGMPKFAKSGVPENARIRFDVRMLDITPSLPEGPFRILVTQNNSGAGIHCGEEAKFNVVIWDTDGKKLYYSPSPIIFTPGKSQVFLGLEQGVVGMSRGSSRTLIVPPAFQKTMNGNAPSIDFPLPKTQTVLVDVEALP